MIYSKELPNVNEKIKEIQPITETYKFEDLLKAIFCVNICVNNRSVLASQLTLNLSLILNEKKGKRGITNYNEFQDFFSKIQPILQPDYMDDYIIEDFGEVKFKYKNKYYNVILGTGHNQVFGELYFLESVAKKLNKEDELERVFQYNSNIIEYFKEVNKSNEEGKKRLVLPNEELFERTLNFFENEVDNLNIEEIYKIMGEQKRPIEKTYFVKKDMHIYPLYNNAILIDIFDFWYRKINIEERSYIADLGITKVLSDITLMNQGNQPNVIFPISLFDSGKVISKYIYTFVIKCNNSAIIAINRDQFENEEKLNEEIDKIKRAHIANNLNLIEVISRNEGKGNLGVTIRRECELQFIIYNSHVNISEMYMSLKEGDAKYFECTAIDLVYMLLFMDDQEELVTYISEQNAEKDYEQMTGFGGDSSKFLMWKDCDHMIVKGAIRYRLIDIGYNEENDYVLEYFKNELKNYPFNVEEDFLFRTPFSWKIEKNDDEYNQYVYKIKNNFGGSLKRLINGAVIFFTYNFDFFRNVSNGEEYFETIHFIEELNLRKIKKCEEVIEKSKKFSNKVVQIMFMPIEYARKVRVRMDDKRKYVYSDCYEENNVIIIRYIVNYAKLQKDIMSSSNRKIENLYFKELLKPLQLMYKEEYDAICDKLDKEEGLKKEVDVFALEIDYIYNRSIKDFYVEDINYLNVKKEIAKICLDSGIKSGEYFGKDANRVIRLMQKKLIEAFEKEIMKYNRKHLHIELLEILANTCNSINVYRKRYNSFKDIDEEILEEVQKKTIIDRERDKHNYKTLLYLIESNLYLERDINNKIDSKGLQHLLAFSNWLVVLSDSADICYFTDQEAHIKVNYDYVVDTFSEESDDSKIENFNKRVYSSNGYTIKGDKEDYEFLEKVQEQFKNDTNIDIICIFDVCHYFQRYAVEENKCTQLSSNVYSISTENLISDIGEYIRKNSKENFSEDEIRRAIEFITIDVSKLKTINNKEDYYLPIGEREKRNYRFDIRTLLKESEMIVFSPVLVSNVQSQWKNGIVDNYLPYEIGLDLTVKTLMDWKKKYEKEMVFDIEKIFKENNINFVRTNTELHKIDKKGNHPLELGDYDVLAIDDCKFKIWIVESKVLKKVGSFFEMYNQQRRFFLEHKEDEKFQRRIDYMNANYKKVLKALGFDTSNEYKVVPYMVMNKVMSSRYKKIEFPIISIEELENEIRRENE